MASRKLPVLVVAGIGNGQGTGAATARYFAKNGYRVALLARNADSLKALSSDINKEGGDAAGFPLNAYTFDSVKTTFQDIKKQWPDSEIRASLWNAGVTIFKGFLDVTEADVHTAVESTVVGAYAFARESVLAFKDLPLNEQGKRGTLFFTGATSSIRGNVMTSAMAPAKHALRGLSQSLAKEFNKQNIHVAHLIVDGMIKTDQTKQIRSQEDIDDPDAMLTPEGVAKTYWYLANQERSTWTWELDLRPAHEKW